MGAVRAEIRLSSKTPTKARNAPPVSPEPIPVRKEQQVAVQLRPEEQDQGEQKQARGLCNLDGADTQIGGVDPCHAQNHEQQPQRRRKVGHGAGPEVQPADGVKPLHKKESKVLQVPLAPPLVALCEVDQC